MSFDPVIGATITGIRQLTKLEMKEEGWEHHDIRSTTVLILSNGAILYPSADPEGNGPGALFGKYKADGFYVNS